MSKFRIKQIRIRREAQEREESMKYYMEHKNEIDSYREACAILARLSRINHVANKLTVEDILNNVNNREELDFYYRWCLL